MPDQDQDQDQDQIVKGLDACSAMHTALRKRADSKATTALYNLVWLIDDEDSRTSPWVYFGHRVVEHMDAKVASTEAIRRAARQLELVPVELWTKLPKRRRNEFLALSATLALLNEKDVEAMASFLS